jgi:hypothetical protein
MVGKGRQSEGGRGAEHGQKRSRKRTIVVA